MFMRVTITTDNAQYLDQNLLGKLNKLLSPFVGICQEIGYMKRSSSDPFLITLGAELTGLHTVLNRPNPGRGGYHIGGVGYFHNEAMIKAVAESLERYSQLLSEATLKGVHPREFLSYEEMKIKYSNIIDEKCLNFFLPDQFKKIGFPYKKFDANSPITWVEITALDQSSKTWIPAQLLFVGYNCLIPDEPWLSSAVTTGTAAHCTREKAILSAISELIQIDAAMGHWYTNSEAILLTLDERVKHFLSFLNKVMNPYTMSKPHFYLLESKRLPGFNIACVFKKNKESIPRFAVGLGSDCCLEKALYKSFLEGYGVVGLARLNVFKEKNQSPKNLENFYDLDSNVAAYAKGSQEAFFEKKFPLKKGVKTSKLTPDWTFETEERTIYEYTQVFKRNNMDLYYTDLTSPEAKEVGFNVARIWSPHTISLCLPSAVQKNHSRFKDYGGVTYDAPHPYP